MMYRLACERSHMYRAWDLTFEQYNITNVLMYNVDIVIKVSGRGEPGKGG